MIGLAQHTPYSQRQSVPLAERFGTPPTPSSSPVSDAGADGFDSVPTADGSDGLVAAPFISRSMASITVPALDSDDDANSSSSSSGGGSDRDGDGDGDGHNNGSSTDGTDSTDSTGECSSNSRTRCYVEASCGNGAVEPRPSKKQRTYPLDEAQRLLTSDAAATGSMIDNSNETRATMGATRVVRGFPL